MQRKNLLVLIAGFAICNFSSVATATTVYTMINTPSIVPHTETILKKVSSKQTTRLLPEVQVGNGTRRDGVSHTEDEDDSSNDVVADGRQEQADT
jgi:hypothetical protein